MNAMNTIQMPNRLIFAPQDYEKLEKRLLYLSLIQIRDRQIPTQQLSLFANENPEELFDTTEYSEKERTVKISYEEMKSCGSWRLFQGAIMSFGTKSITYRYKDAEKKENSYEETINLVESCRRYKGQGAIILFTNKGYKILTHLSKSYTKIPLDLALKLSSKYSQRIYEILIARCFGNENGRFKVSLEEFKKLLGIPEGKYEHWGSLEKITLLKAKEELEQRDENGALKTALSFDYVTVKQGRKVVGLDISVWIPSAASQLQLGVVSTAGMSEKQLEIMNKLQQLNVAEKYHSIIAMNHAEAFFKWNYQRSMNPERIISPAGHLLKTLGLV